MTYNNRLMKCLLIINRGLLAVIVAASSVRPLCAKKYIKSIIFLVFLIPFPGINSGNIFDVVDYI